jgi:hypothetical protein
METMASVRIAAEPAGNKRPTSGLEYSWVSTTCAVITPKNRHIMEKRGGPKLWSRALCSSVAKKGAFKRSVPATKPIPAVSDAIDMTPSVEPSAGMKATATAGPSVSGTDSKKRRWKPPRTNVGASPRKIGPSKKYIQTPTISPRMAV